MAKITMGAVGDIKFGTRLKPSPLYDILRRSTVAAANLECPLTHGEIPADKLFTIKASPSIARQLPGLGLKVVSVANNHAMDYTDRGLMDTISHVTRAGVRIVGGGKNLEEALAPAIVKAGPVKIAFLGVACTLPAGFAATDKKPGIAPIRISSTFAVDPGEMEEQPGSCPFIHTQVVREDLQAVIRAIEKAKTSADLVVVSIHWGIVPGWQPVFQGSLAEYQAPLGRSLIDAGGDIILGHHPHVLDGIETYRKGIIFYSLGHFIFQSKEIGQSKEVRRGERAKLRGSAESRKEKISLPVSPYTRGYKEAVVTGVRVLLSSRQAKESMIALIHIDVLKGKKPRIIGAEIIPSLLDEDGESVECNPEQAEAILTRLTAYSEEFGTRIRVANQKGYVDIA